MRKRLLLGLVTAMSVSVMISGQPQESYAATMKTSLDQKQSEIKDKQSTVKSDIEVAKKKLDSIAQEKNKMNKEIEKLDSSVTETSRNIRKKEEEIKVIEEQMKIVQQELLEVNERIEARTEILKGRARSIQQNGNITYLDVVFGAKSFGDLISRVNAVSTIMNADKELLDEQEADKKIQEKNENKLKEQKASNEKSVKELHDLETSLQKQIEEKNELMKKLNDEEEHIHGEVYNLEDEAELLAAQEIAIKREIEAYEQRKALKKIGVMPELTDGTFMNPTTGILSSNYGQRDGRLHAGVDIANANSNVPVVSSADGTVIRSYYSTSYGNVIFIAHNIDGQTFTTVSAHLEERIAEDGQKVKKGELIGYMGNTGNSFGKHLHFEIHKGNWNANKTNSIDPRPYLSY